jgi:aspartyl-tRNA(Asn)/glutamyl-tRNA(Gln) amidotransferase subunit A
MTMDLTKLTIVEAGAMLRLGETTSLALTEAALNRAGELEPRLNAFITVTADAAMASASVADTELKAGRDRGPLHGIPIGIKDLCATKGIRTTAGSKILEHWIPDFDATVVSKLGEAGAVSIGKLNLHEFAFGTTSNNQWYGAVHNPWDVARHPGGSSGGSGAAVASGEVFAAIGTDTGGSIRIPAALCGTVGLMPSRGLVSRAGVTPLSWSLDHIGPLTRTVRDAALFLNAITGYDSADSASAITPVGFDATALLGQGVRGLRIGVTRSQWANCEDGVGAAVDEALRVLAELGAEVTDIVIPSLDAGFRSSVLTAEAAAYHAQWLRERPMDFGDEIRPLLLYGLTMPAHEYINDLRLRAEFTAEVREAMERIDVIAGPTCERVASPIAELASDAGYRYSVLCAPWDHTGQPSISVPCGFGADHMPVGLMLTGRPFEEALLCRMAHAYEQATSWHTMWPPL